MQSRILHGDCRKVLRDLPDESVHCVVTSPPYWGLRSYGGDEGMIGLEPTFEEHLVNLVAVFSEVWRVLRSDGTLWLNYGDAYSGSPPRVAYGDQADNSVIENKRKSKAIAGLKPKDLMMMPARVAIALQADGWWLRSEIIWHKPNPMPESVTDRPTNAHEKLFLLTKSARYFYDAEAVRVRGGNGWHGDFAARSSERRDTQGLGSLRGQYAKPYEGNEGKDFADTGAQDARSVKSRIVEGVRNGTITGANLRNVWTIPTHSYKDAHFATFPPKLVEPCIKAGTSERGVCGECGAPWTRQVDTVKGGPVRTRNRREVGREETAAGFPQEIRHTTTGWAPTCDHKAATVPGTVLDPFAGSGTVGQVALSHGRSFIGVEINPEYVEMGKRRTDTVAPLFTNARGTR